MIYRAGTAIGALPLFLRLTVAPRQAAAMAALLCCRNTLRPG
jgi:hypothetical protein